MRSVGGVLIATWWLARSGADTGGGLGAATLAAGVGCCAAVSTGGEVATVGGRLASWACWQAAAAARFGHLVVIVRRGVDHLVMLTLVARNADHLHGSNGGRADTFVTRSGGSLSACNGWRCWRCCGR